MEGFRERDADVVAWALLGLVFTVAVVAVAWNGIGAIVFGVFLYYALRPLDRRFRRVVDSKGLSALLTLVAFGIPLILVVGYASLVAYQALNDLLGQGALSDLADALRPYVNVSGLTEPSRLFELLRNNAGEVMSFTEELLKWTIRMTVTLTVAFYLLRDDDRIAIWFRETFHGNDDAVEFAERVDHELRAIYTGNLVMIIVNAVLSIVVFVAFNWAVGMRVIEYPVILGLLIGVVTLLPAIGIFFVYFPYTAYLFVQAFVWETLPKWVPIVFFATTFFIVDVAPDYVVRAYVAGDETNTGLLLLAFVLGSFAFGWYGIFLAPILLVLFLHFTQYIFPRLVRGSPEQLAPGRTDGSEVVPDGEGGDGAPSDREGGDGTSPDQEGTDRADAPED